MTSDLEEYKKRVEAQKEELLTILAKIGLVSDYEIDVGRPAEDMPLTEIFYAVQIAAENLSLISSQLQERVREAERNTQTIAAQRQAILELSTPVIEVWDGIVVLPLIGTVDTMRAKQILEQLLSTIKEKRALVAIIDITGLPVVDTNVAGHLQLTAQSADMLGAECIITGISPANAQTLIRAGVRMTDVVTKGTLEAGLKYAFSVTGKRVVSLAEWDRATNRLDDFQFHDADEAEGHLEEEQS